MSIISPQDCSDSVGSPEMLSCSSGEPIQTLSQTLATFAPDGTLSESSLFRGFECPGYTEMQNSDADCSLKQSVFNYPSGIKRVQNRLQCRYALPPTAQDNPLQLENSNIEPLVKEETTTNVFNLNSPSTR